jgi:TolB-like protein
MAPRDVKPGAQYADAIVRAISDAKTLVMVLSESSVGSSHVGREIERAASKRKQIIALKVDAAVLTPALEYFLSESQWIDALALGMPGALGKLVEAVGQGSAATQTNPVSGSGGSGGASGRSAINRGSSSVAKRVLAAAIVVALGVGGVLAVRFWQSKRGESEASAVTVISDRSIAVLPFADLSEKHDQEYFADGIAEEVLNRLAQVPGIKVVGRASSFQFRGKSSDPASIGTALGVAYLLEGSVRKEAGRVRVTAQLIDVKTASQRWADGFDSDVIDVLKVQDTIAAEIARALQLAVEVATTPRPSVKSPQALEAYMRGLQS